MNNIFWSLGGLMGLVLLYQILFIFLKKWTQKKKRILPDLLTTHIYYPGLLFVIIVALFMTLVVMKNYIPLNIYIISKHTISVLFIATSGFLVIRAITLFRELTFHHYALNNPSGVSLRKTKTQFQLIQRILNVIILFGTVCIILMTFESVRQIGGTLLASAGVVGLVIGFAAQKSLGTLFAGIQIALSQPIRIDDVVVVENEFGTIGEINLTYVIIHCWDGRRLVVPISYFLEKPFENWTRISPEVIAKVKIYADYSLPVDEMREEYKKWISETELWDRRTFGLLMTGANDRTIEIRGTASARNSDDAYELSCFLREKMIAYVRTKHPKCLPRTRLENVN